MLEPEAERQNALFSQIKTLARHSVTYGLSDILGKAGASLLLVPFYTRHLATADYGFLEFMAVTQGLLLVVAVLGLNSALTRYYATASDPGERRLYFRTTLTTVLIFSGVLSAILFLIAPLLAGRLLGNRYGAILWRFLAMTLLLEALCTVCLALFRSQSRPMIYSTVNLTKLLAALVLNVVFVGALRLGVTGVLLGNLLGSGVGTVLGLAFARSQVGFAIERAHLSRLLRFGVPLIGGGIGFFVINSADRYFLKAYRGLSDLGIYALSYKVGMTMSILVNAFVAAWPPLLFRIAEQSEAKKIFARVFTYYLFVSAWVLIGVASLSREIVATVGTPGYAGAAPLIGFILLSYLLQGVYYIFLIGVSLTERTKLVPLIVGLGAAANIASNMLLIPRWGTYGAAWATVISCFCLAAGAYTFSQTYYPIRFELKRIGLLILAGAVILAVNLKLAARGSFLVEGVKLGLVASFPLLLAAAGFFESEEIRRARRLLTRTMHRLLQRES
jgi:O-antigen/teichoic acid export membrane protein